MKKVAAFISAFGLPMVALAVSAPTIGGMLSVVKNIIDIATIVAVAIALLFFIWGLAQYILSGPGEKADEGRQRMIYGIIALFVIVSIWGLVNVLNSTFGVTQGGSATLPSVTGTIIP